ncbi:hypothetical protein CHS0354_032037 [Potamilus streckersoni]|uniref:Uncharacterized protein n=1 Tax=Potamilus streckersoni TaxID=2493646 RepID=A0AAE0TPD9_9BIVA|nr:hypothetical protein CHS0354_032037 [Potamilus streckersoni]
MSNSVPRANQGRTRHMLGIPNAITATLDLTAHQEQYRVRNVKLENISPDGVKGGVRIVNRVKPHLETDPPLKVNVPVLLEVTIIRISNGVTSANQESTRHMLGIPYHVRTVKLANISPKGVNPGASFVNMVKPQLEADPPLKVNACALREHSDQIKVKLARNVPLVHISQNLTKLYVIPASLVHIRIKQARLLACNVYREVTSHPLDWSHVSNAFLAFINQIQDLQVSVQLVQLEHIKIYLVLCRAINALSGLFKTKRVKLIVFRVPKEAINHQRGQINVSHVLLVCIKTLSVNHYAWNALLEVIRTNRDLIRVPYVV